MARNWFTRSFHFYPRSPCGERHHKQAQSMYHNTISIHALLAESDSAAVRLAVLSYYISIHALLAESDSWHFASIPENCNFYPRSPCGERPLVQIIISGYARDFYPRSPCGERLREPTALRTPHHFYPRSPCGERRPRVTANTWQKVFLSTLSLRRATQFSDVRVYWLSHFYPRSPCGERRKSIGTLRTVSVISIHALLAESDSGHPETRPSCAISIHALLAESDVLFLIIFQPS